jgi:hypothetical protein
VARNCSFTRDRSSTGPDWSVPINKHTQYGTPHVNLWAVPWYDPFLSHSVAGLLQAESAVDLVDTAAVLGVGCAVERSYEDGAC